MAARFLLKVGSMETQVMKTVLRSSVLILSVVMLLSAALSNRSLAATDACTNPIFTPVLESLKAKTGVPLRLPLIVGEEYDAALYAEVGWIGNTRYVVRIGQNCERGYCPYGSVSGTKIAERTSRPGGKVIELAGGVTGYFIDGSKSLKNSTITWDEGQYRYEIMLYAAERAAIVKVVNSALSCDKQ
jgi:hypothetical protein